MKFDENNQQHAELIARYLSGEMDRQELELFENWISGFEGNYLLIKNMKKQWELMENYQPDKTPDAGKAWEKLQGRLQAENLIPAQTRKPKMVSVSRLLKVAAIAFVLVSVGIAVYYGANRKASPEMVRINTANEPNTLIKTLADGSVIYLAGNSTFVFPVKFEPATRNVALKGEAFFDVSPNPAKPFIIETDEAFIEVLGTAFNVKTANGSDFELLVDRGKIKVTMKNNPSESELVAAGEKLVLSKNTFLKSKRENGLRVGWFTKNMKFKDETLQDIINVINRNFNTTFVVANSGIGNRRLTVTFNNEPAATMTELICLTLNLKSRNANGYTVLFDANPEKKSN